jgi:DNA polymerase I
MTNLVIFTDIETLENNSLLINELFGDSIILTEEKDLLSHSPKVILTLCPQLLEKLIGISSIKSPRGKILFSEKYNCNILTTLDINKLGKKGKTFDNNKYQIDKRLVLSDFSFAQEKSKKVVYKHSYVCIQPYDIESFDRFIKKISSQETWSFDIEVEEDEFFRIENSSILGIGFSWKSGTGVYVVLQDKKEKLSKEYSEYVINKLKTLFSNNSKKIAHNGKYDVGRLLGVLNIKTNNFYFDTMLAHHILDENRRHGLDDISTGVSDLSSYKHESEAFLPSKNSPYSVIPTSVLAKRCCADADLTLRLGETEEKDLLRYDKLHSLFNQIIMPHQDLIMRGELRGVLIDIQELHRIEPIIKMKMDTFEAEVYDAIGEKINLNSPKQLIAIFNKLKLNIPDDCITDTGNISTDQETLNLIKDQHPFCSKLVRYKQLKKLYSTYIVGISKRLDQNNIIHTSYKLHGTVTGRLSSSSPNLQNIPTDQKLSEEYKLDNISIHKLFIARPGYKFITTDASQIELRLLAVLSKDPILMQAYRDNKDLHTLTAINIIHGASQVYNEYLLKKAEDPLYDGHLAAKWTLFRKQAKTVNFGISYGKQAKSLAEELGISKKQAQNFIDNFFDKYQGVYQWMQETIGACKRTGYVENVFGRRRRLTDINSPVQWTRSEAERQCINSAVQGSAADVTAIANIRIDRLFKENNIDGGFILNVHDELVFEVNENQVDLASSLCQKGWKDPIFGIDVPIDISLNSGSSWSK